MQNGGASSSYPRRDAVKSPMLHRRPDDIYTCNPHCKGISVDLRIDHTTDGALIADDLAKEGFPVAVGPSFGHATKYELRHKGFHTPAALAKAGCQVSIITDSPVIEERYLALCAGRAVFNGLSEFDALKAITINAAETYRNRRPCRKY